LLSNIDPSQLVFGIGKAPPLQEKKRKKPKEKRSTRKKIIYDHAAPQVWKKTLNVIENV